MSAALGRNARSVVHENKVYFSASMQGVDAEMKGVDLLHFGVDALHFATKQPSQMCRKYFRVNSRRNFAGGRSKSQIVLIKLTSPSKWSDLLQVTKQVALLSRRGRAMLRVCIASIQNGRAQSFIISCFGFRYTTAYN